MLAGVAGRVYVWWDFADRGDAMAPLTLSSLPAPGSPGSFSALLSPCSCSAAESAVGINPMAAALCSVGLEVFHSFQFK